MKKLMIGMLAAGAAVASAWAQGEAGATVQFSAEAFENAAPDFTVAPWSYTGDADAELTIKTGGGSTSEGKYLELNTASKKLSLAPTATGKYTVTEEVYFDSWVKFDAASDTIPEVSGTDKLALFVLDNTDYIAENGEATTALYVIGGYMNGDTLEKRLYRLNVKVEDDPTFLTSFKRISIKMYSNVIKDGVSIPGFVVRVDGKDTMVNAAYAIAADGSVNFGSDLMEYGSYLGATIDPAVAASRYNTDDAQLILGLARNATTELNAVDFMGKGGIDALAFTNVKNSYGFEADAQLFTVGEYPSNVSGVYESNEDAVGGTNKLAAATTIDVSNGKATLWVVLDGNYYLNGNKIVSVEVGAGDSLADVLGELGDAYEAVLTVGGMGYDADALAEDGALGEEGVAGAIKLLANIPNPAAYLWITGEATLDLNGCTLGADNGSVSIYVNDGVPLAISGAGKVDGKIDGTGTVTIDVNSTAMFKVGEGFNTVVDLNAMLPTGATKEFKPVPDAAGYYALDDKAVEVTVAPGEETVVEADNLAAAEAIASTVKVTVSEEFSDDLEAAGVDVEAYKALFKGKATETADGKYVITLELAPDVKTAVQTAVDTAATDIAEALTSATDSVVITTKPGLFYGIVKQNSLNGMGTAKPGTWTMGTGGELEFDLDKSGNSGFFKVICSPTPAK